MAKNRKEQNEYYKDSDLRWETYPLSKRISYKKKKANDFKWAKECINYIDIFRNHYGYDSRVENLLENYELASGKGENFLDRLLQDNNTYYTVTDPQTGRKKQITFDINQVHHYPIINQIIQGLMGEQYKRQLVPQVEDNSKFSKNLRKRVRDELVRTWISETYIAPIQQQVAMEFSAAEQPQSPEQAAQLEQIYQERVDELTPESIKSYLDNDYLSPLEIAGQRIMNHLMEELRIKEITDDGFEHALITSEEYYYVGLRHGRPVMDKVNPVRFYWSGSSDTEFVEDAEWATYETILTFSEFINRYGDKLEKKDYKVLQDLLLSIHGNSHTDEVQREILNSISVDPESFAGIDIATKEGQRDIISLYTQFSERLHPHWKVRVAHCTWKASRKMYYVERIDPQTNEEGYSYEDETYTMDPLRGDVKMEEFWINEVWEGYKAGYGAGIEGEESGNGAALYFGIQPLPWQYRSSEYVWDCKLPYFGRKYNSLENNAENTTIIDLAKQFSFDFDLEHARLRRDMGHNVGKVFLMLADYIPEGYTMEAFIKFIHEHKIAPVQFHEGAPLPPQFAAQMFKDIDMSTAVDIAQRIQLLRYYQDQIAISMYYNPSRLGQISPYVPVTNNQQNIVQSANQTEKLFRTHSNIVVRSLNALLNVAKIAIRKDENYLADILDDISHGIIKISREMVANSEMGVFVTTSINDIENLNNFKNIVLAKAHSSDVPMVEIAKLMEAKSMAEAILIAEEMDQKRFEREQAMQQSAMAIEQSKQQHDFALKQMDAQIMMQGKAADYKRAVDAAEIQNTRWVDQMDADYDGRVDAIEKEEREQAYEMTRQQREQEFEESENEKDRKHQLEMEKLKAKNKSN